MKKRLISLLMALAMAAALLPLDAALAADGEEGRTPAEAAYEDDVQVPEATADRSAPEDVQPDGEEQAALSLQEASEGEAEPEQESEKPNQKEDYLRRPTGYIPIQKDLYVADPAALQTLEGEDVPLKEELPAAYRSDEQPWAAKIRVKDQMKVAICWAFAMTSAAEYSYAKELYEKTGEIYSGELSPGHIAQFIYNRIMDPLENTEGDFNDLQEGGAFLDFGRR